MSQTIKQPNPLNLGLWVTQALLSAMFLYAGYLKLTSPPTALDSMGWHWALDVPPALIAFIGAMEILGAIGVVLPMATRILPWLTAMAAAGMVLLQLAAVALHVSRGEYAALWLNIILLAAAAFVVWGRMATRPAPV